jgi:hypothetical protein
MVVVVHNWNQSGTTNLLTYGWEKNGCHPCTNEIAPPSALFCEKLLIFFGPCGKVSNKKPFYWLAPPPPPQKNSWKAKVMGVCSIEKPDTN